MATSHSVLVLLILAAVFAPGSGASNKYPPRGVEPPLHPGNPPKQHYEATPSKWFLPWNNPFCWPPYPQPYNPPFPPYSPPYSPPYPPPYNPPPSPPYSPPKTPPYPPPCNPPPPPYSPPKTPPYPPPYNPPPPPYSPPKTPPYPPPYNPPYPPYSPPKTPPYPPPYNPPNKPPCSPPYKPPYPPYTPPYTPPYSSPPYNPPPAGKTCPINKLKLNACLDVLGGEIIGKEAKSKCCPLVQGVADLDAALCLCTTLRTRRLSVHLPVAHSLLVACGKNPPRGFQCPRS